MAKLFLESDIVERDVISNIQSSIDRLDRIPAMVSSLSIPSGFSYKTYLEETSTFAISIKNNLTDLKEWLNTSLKTYSARLSEMDNQLSALSHSKVNLKKNYVIQ